ncbi:MAG: DNA/RNA non-specific endonuclease, partial [Oribacterium sp.]|nr:DNA/RNA non-specific endonuclease [Oribacterium sp.]
GTRYLNVTGMLPYENTVADYVRSTGNHVLYRVTPYFVGKELVARGVLMEAESIEDTRISFCVWCYNVQPGIMIDYAAGGSAADPNAAAQLPAPTTTPTTASQVTTPSQSSVSARTECTYILNTNTKRIHLPTCSSVNEMKPSNRQEFSGDVTGLLEQGYKACGRCHPF